MTNNLAELLDRSADARPDAPAVVFHDHTWTYRQLQSWSDAVAAALTERGLRAGDRLAMLLPNGPALLLGYLACFKSGVVAVPLNYRYRSPEIDHAMEDSGASALVAHRDRSDDLAGTGAASSLGDRLEIVEDDLDPFAAWGASAGARRTFERPDLPAQAPVAIMYTSGSTGPPKGVTYSRASLASAAFDELPGLHTDAQTVAPVIGSFAHEGPLTLHVIPVLRAGGRLILMDRHDAEHVADVVIRHRCTCLGLLCALLQQVLDEPAFQRADLSSVRFVGTGGDEVPHSLFERVRERFGLQLITGYGLTESPHVAINAPGPRYAPGSIGVAMPSRQVRLIDDDGRDVASGQVGQIIVRSPASMLGYWNNPQQTARALRDGYVHTGDLARQDEAGRYWFVGRSKRIIIVDGSNVGPGEVEDVLDDHPSVKMSAVVGVPDRRHGHIVAAFVQLKPGAEPTTPEALRAWARERLAANKAPVRVTIVNELPLTESGKVDRQRLLDA